MASPDEVRQSDLETMASPSERHLCDLENLILAGYKVKSDNLSVILDGPMFCPYYRGVWNVSVSLPKEYPNMPPSIAFANKIYHPTIDEMSGLVCPELLKKAWNPNCDLVYLFKGFLPHLLMYPDVVNALNEDVRTLMTDNKAAYYNKVRYANPELGETSHDEIEDEQGNEAEDEHGNEAEAGQH